MTMALARTNALLLLLLALCVPSPARAQAEPRELKLLFYGPSARANDAALRRLFDAAKAESHDLAIDDKGSFTVPQAIVAQPDVSLRALASGTPHLSLEARKDVLRNIDAVVFVPMPQRDDQLERRSLTRLTDLLDEIAGGETRKPVAIVSTTQDGCGLDPSVTCFAPTTDGPGPFAIVAWAVASAMNPEGPAPEPGSIASLAPMRYPEPPNGLSALAKKRLAAAQKALERPPVGPVAQTLGEELLPAVWITPQAQGRPVALGTSRFGGAPDVPAGFQWPKRDEQPLTFLAQIRLSDVRDLDGSGLLPDRGWLLVFYDVANQPWGDPSEAGGSRVLWVDTSPESLHKAQAPAGDEQAAQAPATAVVFRAGYTLPTTAPENTLDALDLPDDPGEAYQRLRDQIGLIRPEVQSGRHHLLGHPDEIQGEMRTQLGAAAAENEGVDDWILLLQLDSEQLGDAQWSWGDAGRLFFWIRKDELAKRNFDRVWCLLQSN